METKYYAFFDVDGTVINFKSMFNFLEYYMLRKYKHTILGKFHYLIFCIKVKLLYFIGKDRAFINTLYYQLFEGETEDSLISYGEAWFNDLLKTNSEIWKPVVVNEIHKHIKLGATVVLVSGSMVPCLSPIAKYLGIQCIIATGLEVEAGVLTGKIESQTIGQGKANQIKIFLEDKKFNDFDCCYAYGDHRSDLSMLRLVGHPYVCRGDKKLEEYASKLGWGVL